MKRWYSAHVVMYFRFVEGKQTSFPVYENVLLLSAASEKIAWLKASRLGRAAEDPTSRYGNRKAVLTFAGVRKVIRCEFADRLYDGAEATYSQFRFRTKGEFVRFVRGGAVSGTCVE